jgi:hypothetical protein
MAGHPERARSWSAREGSTGNGNGNGTGNDTGGSFGPWRG